MMRKITEVIIHCSATPPDWMHGNTAAAKAKEIKRWHVQDNGWSDIGYHHLIDRDGQVVLGRPIERAGAHTQGHNSNSVGVCLIGAHGASADDRFDDHFTPAQREAMHRVVDSLQTRFGPLKVSGHNQYANKGCPGFRVAAEFAKPVREVDHIEQTEKPAPPSPWAALFAAIASIFGGKK